MSIVVEITPKDPAPLVEAAGSLVSDNGDIKVEFVKDEASGVNAVVFTASNGYWLKWLPGKIQYICQTTGIEDVLYEADSSPQFLPTRQFHAYVDRHYPGVEENFLIEAGKLKHNINLRIDQRAPIEILEAPWLAVYGTIEFHPDLTIRSANDGVFETYGALEIVDAAGCGFTLPPVAAWDNQNSETSGKYIVSPLNPGRVELATAVDYAWLNAVERSYPVTIDPTVIVSSGDYDTSGNGGRKLVRLSNGWLVAAARDSVAAQLNFYVSKDSGATWTQLCYRTAATGSFALASAGTTVYAPYKSSTNSFSLIVFDATTVTNTNVSGLTGPPLPDGSTINDIEGISVQIGGSGNVHCAVAQKTTLDPNSWNIFYYKYLTAGAGSWATPEQRTTYDSTSIRGATKPCIVALSSGKLAIFWQYEESGVSYGIGGSFYDGTNWTIIKNSKVGVYSAGSTYAQYEPSATVGSNDEIDVYWHGYDAQESAKTNIRHSRSVDYCNSWSAMTKITLGNTYSQVSPSPHVEVNGTRRVLWIDRAASGGTDQIRIASNTGNGWGTSIVLVASATSVVNPSVLCSKFNENSSDALRYSYMDGSAVKYDSISLNVAPLAPTNPSPSGGLGADRATVIRFSWQHNDSPGDPQAAFEMQWRKKGDTAWNLVGGTGVDQFVDVATNTLPFGDIEWQVRTQDQGGLWSPWSSQAVLKATDKPAAPVITAPTGNVTEAKPVVTWSSVDQAAYQVVVLDDQAASVYDSGEAAGTNKARQIGYALSNGKSYTIKVRVKNADGLWSDYATLAISTSFTPPAAPTLITSAAAGYINLQLDQPNLYGKPGVGSLEVWRREVGDTQFKRIATDIVLTNTVNLVYNSDFESVTSTAQVFSDAMTSAAAWTAKAGVFTYGANGAVSQTSFTKAVAGNSAWKPLVGSGGQNLSITKQATFTQGVTVPANNVLYLYVDEANSYYVQLVGNTFALKKVVAGTSTTLGSVAQTQAASAAYTMTISLDKNGLLTAKLYAGTTATGTPIQTLTATDTSLNGGFLIGVGGDAGVVISNAKVTAPFPDGWTIGSLGNGDSFALTSDKMNGSYALCAKVYVQTTVYQQLTVEASKGYAVSVHAKVLSGTAAMRVSDAGANAAMGGYTDLNSAAWTRFSQAYTQSSATTARIAFEMKAGSTKPCEFLIDSAQLEASATATPYIRNDSTTVPAKRTSYKDYTVASGKSYEYMARAIGLNGAATDSTVQTSSIKFSGVWLHAVDDPAGTAWQFRFNENRSVNPKVQAERMQFAGRSRQVTDFGETDEFSVKFDLSLLKEDPDYEKILALLWRKTTLCYRDARGRKVFGTLDQLPGKEEFWGDSVSLEIWENDYSEVV